MSKTRKDMQDFERCEVMMSEVGRLKG